MDGEAAVAPGAITKLASDDHVVQRIALALGRVRYLPGRAVHARQPPLRHDDWFGDFLEVDDTKAMIGKAVEVRRNIGITPAHPGQAVDAKSRHFQKRDLSHFAGFGDVVDRQAAAEVLTLGDAFSEAVFEIAALVAIGLHGDDIGTVGDEKQIVR